MPSFKHSHKLHNNYEALMHLGGKHDVVTLTSLQPRTDVLVCTALGFCCTRERRKYACCDCVCVLFPCSQNKASKIIAGLGSPQTSPACVSRSAKHLQTAESAQAKKLLVKRKTRQKLNKAAQQKSGRQTTSALHRVNFSLRTQSRVTNTSPKNSCVCRICNCSLSIPCRAC